MDQVTSNTPNVQTQIDTLNNAINVLIKKHCNSGAMSVVRGGPDHGLHIYHDRRVKRTISALIAERDSLVTRTEETKPVNEFVTKLKDTLRIHEEGTRANVRKTLQGLAALAMEMANNYGEKKVK